MLIDCDQCVMQHTEACDNCVVTFLVNRKPGEPVVIDEREEHAMAMLGGAGLVPRLRLVPKLRAS